MRVLIVGATGFIGKRLVELLRSGGHEVVVVSRDPEAARRAFPGIEVPEANPPDAATMATLIAKVDGIVNLAGDSIAEGRWTEAKKSRIRESRVSGTRAIARAFALTTRKPRVLVNASAVGIYGPRDDKPLAEGDEGAPTDFLSHVCRAWETEALAIREHARVVVVRFGVVLGKGGGALSKMVPPFRMFVGGPMGSGKQWLSWVHVDDAAGIVVHALTHDDVEGAVNAVAPDARSNADFSRTLAKVLKRPCLFPVPPFVLRTALGEMADMLLTGQRVVPRRAQELGYAFQHPELEAALREILGS